MNIELVMMNSAILGGIALVLGQCFIILYFKFKKRQYLKEDEE